MADAKNDTSKSADLEAAQEDRGEERHTAEEIEQQDLNQGMDTGTHDSTRHGVEWGRSYRTRPKKAEPKEQSGKQKTDRVSKPGE
jgi:hypothetical protein